MRRGIGSWRRRENSGRFVGRKLREEGRAECQSGGEMDNFRVADHPGVGSHGQQGDVSGRLAKLPCLTASSCLPRIQLLTCAILAFKVRGFFVEPRFMNNSAANHRSPLGLFPG